MSVFRQRGVARCFIASIISPVGVIMGVDFTQSFDVDVGVDLGCFHTRVAEHFLDVAGVSPAAMHVGGAGVAEKAAGTGLVNPAAMHKGKMGLV